MIPTHSSEVSDRPPIVCTMYPCDMRPCVCWGWQAMLEASEKERMDVCKQKDELIERIVGRSQ